MLEFLQNEAQRLYFADDDLLQTAFNVFKKVHRCSESLNFLQTCYENKLTPSSIERSLTKFEKIGMTPTENRKNFTRKLHIERDKKSLNLKSLENQFDLISLKIHRLCNSPLNHPYFINLIKNMVKNFEKKFDQKRNKKLKNLMAERNTIFNTVTVHNRTDTEIPQNILNLLSLDKNRGIGSPFKDNNAIIKTHS